MNHTLEAKGIKVNILLLLGSLVISLCVLEGGLRYFTVFPIHGHHNLQPHKLLGFTLSTSLPDVDGDGFRNPLDVNAKILAIGDSHTQGYNVTAADSWPAKLSLKIRNPVYNAGVGGYGVLHYGVLLANLPVGTEEIILGLYMGNDFDFTTPEDECITELGRQSIEHEFHIPVPPCEYQKKDNDSPILTPLQKNSAVVSAYSYFVDSFFGQYDFRKKEGKAKKN